jgi:hypothetical protein
MEVAPISDFRKFDQVVTVDTGIQITDMSPLARHWSRSVAVSVGISQNRIVPQGGDDDLLIGRPHQLQDAVDADQLTVVHLDRHARVDHQGGAVGDGEVAGHCVSQVGVAPTAHRRIAGSQRASPDLQSIPAVVFQRVAADDRVREHVS